MKRKIKPCVLYILYYILYTHSYVVRQPSSQNKNMLYVMLLCNVSIYLFLYCRIVYMYIVQGINEEKTKCDSFNRRYDVVAIEKASNDITFVDIFHSCLHRRLFHILIKYSWYFAIIKE